MKKLSDDIKAEVAKLQVELVRRSRDFYEALEEKKRVVSAESEKVSGKEKYLKECLDEIGKLEDPDYLPLLKEKDEGGE